jgi:hypothetical protein
MPPKPLCPKRAGTIFRYAPAKPGEAQGHYIVRVLEIRGLGLTATQRPSFLAETVPCSAA